MNAKPWILYGATGYTGRLTAELAVQRGERPILAGRTRAALETMGRELRLETRAFDLHDPRAVRDGIRGAAAVLHDAGPFSTTSRPMVDACIAERVHYLDITGELDVFEAIFARDAEAKLAGVTLLPGVGFDVVPTDCLAAMLHERMPTATHLELAFAGLGAMSRGTAKTSVERLGIGGAARIEGKLQVVPHGWRKREIEFPHGRRTVVSIPWGDVVTAYRTTGIPNIVTYMAASRTLQRQLVWLERFRPLLRVGLVQRALKRAIDRRPAGPSETQRETGYTDLFGEARDARGRVETLLLTTPDGYTLTADSSLRAVRRLCDGGVPTGALTPALAFGARFILDCEGVTLA